MSVELKQALRKGAMFLLLYSALAAFAAYGLWRNYQSEAQQARDEHRREVLETQFERKGKELESLFAVMYESARTISLLPSVRSVTGGNRAGEDEDVVANRRMSADAFGTVQQLYNNLAIHLDVSEIYYVRDGLDFTRGQVPFFMFDAVKIAADGTEEAEAARPADFPEESEEAEYLYYPKQIEQLRAMRPRFDFQRLDDIPAVFSSLMRTCDNRQYLSTVRGNVGDANGMLYSVPVYDLKGGALSGIISVIVRANVLEAALMGIPFVPVTEADQQAAAQRNIKIPAETAPFALINEKYDIRIADRRNGDILNIAASATQGNGEDTFVKTLAAHGDAEWKLYFHIPAAAWETAVQPARELFRQQLLGLGTIWLLVMALTGFIVRRQYRDTVELNRFVERVVEVQDSGDYSKRVPVMSKGKIGQTAQAFNNMMDSLQAALGETVKVMDAVARGDFSARIKADLHGDLAHLKQSINASVDTLAFTMQELTKVMQALQSGDLGKRVDARVEGEFRLAVDGAMQSMQSVLGSVGEAMAAAAAGDFSRKAEVHAAQGSFRELGDAANRLMQDAAASLGDVQRVLRGLAQGDLTVTITRQYAGVFGEMAKDANATTENLKLLAGEIKAATGNINSAAHEIAAGNADLSQRTEKQAASLEVTASTMEELASTVRQNADNAKQANSLAIAAANVAGKGGAVVGQVVATMDSINDSSRKIEDIISVIDSIAFQTNILALNAAVEAARAGEQGKGFAVVAGEVRNLAHRSAAAAKEIKHLIGDSVNKVGEGGRQVAEAGQTMEEIVASIRRVTNIMGEIASSSAEQSDGIDQVKLAITQMDDVTQQNAALVEQAAAAAESLEDQAQDLSQSVGRFKLDDSAVVARTVVAHLMNAVAHKTAKPMEKRSAPTHYAEEDGELEEF